MSNSYQQDSVGYESKHPDTEWTWSLLKNYLTETYETCKTHFQIIQALLKMEKKPAETNIDYSGRIEHYLSRIKTILSARFKAKYGADHTMTADQIFEIIGAITILMKLELDDNLMNFLARDLDECFSCRDIAKHADRYLERRKVADPVLSNPTVNYARNFSSQNCRMEKKYGQCTRQSCRYRHKRPRAPRESSRDHNGRRGGAEPSGKGDFDDKRQVAMVNFVDQEPFENVEYIAEDEYLAELEV